MAGLMRALLLGDVARARLARPPDRLDGGRDAPASTGCAPACRAGWRVGDKTGTGANGADNDLAIAFPPGRAPILIACYTRAAAMPTRAGAQRRPCRGRRALVAAAFA